EKVAPLYPDLGKRANDVFGKGYHLGLIKLDVKGTTASGVEFGSGGTSCQESGKVSGSLETKYKSKDYGISFSEKWNTDNNLGTEVTVQDQFLKGLKISGNFNFSPHTGDKSGGVKMVHTCDKVTACQEINLDSSSTISKTSAVVAYKGWLAGLQTVFDMDDMKFTKTSFALGFSTTDFVLHTCIDNIADSEDQEFSGSIYQKISPKLESGIQLGWSPNSSDTKFGIAAKYEMDKDSSIRAKVNNASLIGLGYQQRLREGVTLTLSALIDAKNFNGGGHKLGLALELEA
ncbi:hypothetical protein NQ314_016976, partial [Rhamnusium bicolor]